MPLFNICGISPLKKSFQIAAVFLDGERESQYAWAIQALVDCVEFYQCDLPRCIIIDRELALLNALENNKKTRRVPILFCRWHVNMNVLAKTKRYFPKPTRLPNGQIERHESFKAFLKAYNALIASTTEQDFKQQLEDFKKRNNRYEDAVNYVLNTWITPFKEKIVGYWVNQVAHFGHSTTSIAESSHASLKAYLVYGTGDLATVFRKLGLFWENQHREICLERAKRQNKVAFSSQVGILKDVRTKVVPQAASLIQAELRAIPISGINQPAPWPANESCSCARIMLGMGLPCRHILFNNIRDGKALCLEQIDVHWWWNRPTTIASSPASPGPPEPQDPVIIVGKGRPKGGVETQGAAKRGQGKKGMKRLASGFEIVEAEEQREALPSSTAPGFLQSGDTYEPGTIAPRQSVQFFENLANESKELSEEQDDYDGYIAPNFEDNLDARIEEELGVAVQVQEEEEMYGLVAMGE